MRGLVSLAGAFAAALAVQACSDSAGGSSEVGPGGKPTPGTARDGGGVVVEGGTELRVPVPNAGRVFVKLSTPALAPIADATAAAVSSDWDLAFEGLDVYTNGGGSGAGKGAAFGPLDTTAFLGDTAPATPFLVQDKPGGAFLDWYAYEEDAHVLWSRYHVYGVRDHERLWKVQVLGYYGKRDGATVSALYTLRIAELTTSGAATTEEVALDGTGAGASGGAEAKGECLDLGTGARASMTEVEARASQAWHVCARRSSIFVNGGIGGPREVGAVDLQAADVSRETVDAMKTRTAATELARFEGATTESFRGASFRGDRIVSVFGEGWIVADQTPLTPKPGTWVVLAADGLQKYLVAFTAFEAPTEATPGTVVMRVKAVKG